MLKVHENIGNQRMKFAATISDTAEDLISLSRHIEKDRKKVIVIKKESYPFFGITYRISSIRSRMQECTMKN
jgi:division protein CdvB (Snf7/Vps24/ESCRT-III family)